MLFLTFALFLSCLSLSANNNILNSDSVSVVSQSNEKFVQHVDYSLDINNLYSYSFSNYDAVYGYNFTYENYSIGGFIRLRATLMGTGSNKRIDLWSGVYCGRNFSSNLMITCSATYSQDEYTYQGFVNTSNEQQFVGIHENPFYSWSSSTDNSVSLTLSITFLGADYNPTELYNTGYQDGYTSGYTDGFNVGETEGNNTGYDTGYTEGFNTGHTSGYTEGYNVALSTHNFSFTNLFASIGDTPILMIRRLFGFEIFGVSLISAFMSLFTALIVIKIIKKVF